jgi:hypothetical protein
VRATVELREITQDSLGAVLDLAVGPEQQPYVATNARSIAEAHFEPRAWFRAVYAGEDPVGFVIRALRLRGDRRARGGRDRHAAPSRLTD